MCWPVDVTESRPLTDAMHLTNFINYLYRTDRAQKWTRADTPDNVEFHADSTFWPFSPDRMERYQHKLVVHRGLAAATGADGVMSIRAHRFENLIIYMPDEADPATIAQEFFDLAAEQMRWVIDLVILHADQDDDKHLHVLGHLKQPLRRKPGETMVDAVFSPVL